MIFEKSVKTTYAYQTFSHSIPWISVFWKDDNNQCYLDINKNNNDMKKLPEIYRYSVLKWKFVKTANVYYIFTYPKINICIWKMPRNYEKVPCKNTKFPTYLMSRSCLESGSPRLQWFLDEILLPLGGLLFHYDGCYWRQRNQGPNVRCSCLAQV